MDASVWKSGETYPSLPDYIIPCPLGKDELDQYYSLAQVAPEALLPGHQYHKEEEAMGDFWKNRSVTQDQEDTNHTRQDTSHKRKQQKRGSYVDSTIEHRQKHMAFFVGFCFKWMGLSPSMACVFDPILASKYVGFLVARGNKASYIQKIVQSLGHAVDFVKTTRWPGNQNWGKAWTIDVRNWYQNLNAYIIPNLAPSKEALKHPFTLWTAMSKTKQKWDAFKQAFEVRCALWACFQSLLSELACWSWLLTPMPLHYCTAGKWKGVDVPSAKTVHGVCHESLHGWPLSTTCEAGSHERPSQQNLPECPMCRLWVSALGWAGLGWAGLDWAGLGLGLE